ncbi:MAG: hypothetical protein K9J30_06635 [Bacteroidales bacterium]|nr:hypothetical protein [Bacteroidales bacterium]
MKNLILIITLTIFILSCGSEGTKTGIKETEAINVSIAELVASPESHTDDMVSLKGQVTHVCKHGGQKMFITDESQENNLLIRVSGSIPEFDVTLEGSMVEVTGKLLATIEASEEDHQEVDNDQTGTQNSNKTEDCPTEENLKKEGSATSDNNVTYHVEAVSFKEITEEV